MTAPALITEAEAAAMIGLSPRTLRALRSAGKIRYVRPSPRKVFYKPEDVAEYKDSTSDLYALFEPGFLGRALAVTNDIIEEIEALAPGAFHRKNTGLRVLQGGKSAAK